MQDEVDWKSAVREALEAVRLEAVRRLEAAGLPLTLQMPQMVVVDNEEGNGYHTEWTTRQVSGAVDESAAAALRDDTVPFLSMGMRPQLESLAQMVHEHSPLGQAREVGFLPETTGTDAVLIRYLSAMAMYYLRNLVDLGQAESSLVDRLTAELVEIMVPGAIRHVREVPVQGVVVDRQLTHRDVTIRNLTPEERGMVAEQSSSFHFGSSRPPSDFIVPTQFSQFAPTTLLRTITPITKPGHGDETQLMERVILAFYMQGFPVGCPGSVVSHDEPTWAMGGTHHQPLAVDERFGSSLAIGEVAFKEVVDLAFAIPVFGRTDVTREDIVYGRLLRGLGRKLPQEGFLDLVIALESALLKDINIELSYRFSLYGALFLKDELDPKETFGKLRQIYKIRSDLVHGAAVTPSKLHEAATAAVELATAVGRRIAQSGWPDAGQLDRHALSSLRTYPSSADPSKSKG